MFNDLKNQYNNNFNLNAGSFAGFLGGAYVGTAAANCFLKIAETYPTYATSTSTAHTVATVTFAVLPAVTGLLGSFAGNEFYNDTFNLGHHFAASNAELGIIWKQLSSSRFCCSIILFANNQIKREVYPLFFSLK